MSRTTATTTLPQPTLFFVCAVESYAALRCAVLCCEPGVRSGGARGVQHLPRDRFPAERVPSAIAGQVQEGVGRARGGEFTVPWQQW